MTRRCQPPSKPVTESYRDRPSSQSRCSGAVYLSTANASVGGPGPAELALTRRGRSISERNDDRPGQDVGDSRPMRGEDELIVDAQGR